MGSFGPICEESQTENAFTESRFQIKPTGQENYCVCVWGRHPAKEGIESSQEAAFLSGATAKPPGPRRHSDNSHWQTGPGWAEPQGQNLCRLRRDVQEGPGRCGVGTTGTEPMQTETGRAGGAGRGWAGDHFWSGAAFTVRSKDNKVSFLSQRFKRASELTRWKAGNSGLKPVKTIGLGLGILCSVLTAKDGTGTVVMACPAWLPELRDAAASSPRCDHRHTRVSPSHRCWAWGTWRVSGQRGSHTGWSRAWVSPKQSGPRVQVTTRMLRQGAQTRETEGSHHCARGIPEQRATDTRGKRRDSNLGPRSRKTCHLHPQTEAQETAGTKATFSFTRS